MERMNELAFYTLAGAPRTPRDLIEEVQQAMQFLVAEFVELFPRAAQLALGPVLDLIHPRPARTRVRNRPLRRIRPLRGARRSLRIHTGRDRGAQAAGGAEQTGDAPAGDPSSA